MKGKLPQPVTNIEPQIDIKREEDVKKQTSKNSTKNYQLPA